MTKRASAKQPILLSILFVLLLGLLFYMNDSAMDGVRHGISLCAETLIPSLFPFLVLSDLLVRSGIGEPLAPFPGRLVGTLFRLSPRATSALLLGLLCGQPIATVVALSEYRRQRIEQQELHRLILFANIPSSGFLIGAVGSGLFQNKRAGIALFAITLCSALLLGVLLRLFAPNTPVKEALTSNSTHGALSTKDLTESISQGFGTILKVCAFVLFFSCIGACVGSALTHLRAPDTVNVLLYGFLELSSGISYAVTTLPPNAAFCTAAFFAGFGGLSVCMQIFALSGDSGVSVLGYLACKLIQALLCLLGAQICLLFFSPAPLPTQSVGAFSFSVAFRFFPQALLLLVLFFFLIYKKRGGKAAL